MTNYLYCTSVLSEAYKETPVPYISSMYDLLPPSIPGGPQHFSNQSIFLNIIIKISVANTSVSNYFGSKQRFESDLDNLYLM